MLYFDATPYRLPVQGTCSRTGVHQNLACQAELSFLSFGTFLDRQLSFCTKTAPRDKASIAQLQARETEELFSGPTVMPGRSKRKTKTYHRNVKTKVCLQRAFDVWYPVRCIECSANYHYHYRGGKTAEQTASALTD